MFCLVFEENKKQREKECVGKWGKKVRKKEKEKERLKIASDDRGY